MKIEGIIFDMDGLVFDSERIWQKAFLEANRVFKVPLTEDYRISICGKDEKSIRYELHKMFPSLDENAYRDYMLDFVNNYIEKNAIPLKDSFIEIITYCQQYNLKTALSTASGKRRAESMFNKVGLDVNEVFNVKVFAEDIEKPKPDPEIFLKAANKLGLSPEHCLVMEDSKNGLLAAKNGGFIPVMIPDLIPPDDICREISFSIENNLYDVVDLIEKINIGKKMKTINVENWKRKSAYKNFLTYTNPIVSVCTRLDVTELCKRCKQKGTSFFTDFLYIVCKCLNGIDAFRYRFKNGQVVVYDVINPNFIVLTDEDFIVTCFCEMKNSYDEFYSLCRKNISDAKRKVNVDCFNNSDNSDIFYISCLPWSDFTSVTNPYDLKNLEGSSIPRLTWGKFVEENGRIKMAFDISVHHALMDGEDICRGFSVIQNSLDNIEKTYC